MLSPTGDMLVGMDAHTRAPRVHLCRLSPRRDALDSYFALDHIADAAHPLWEMPAQYESGDTVIIVVPAREPMILNIETLTSSSADRGCDTEDSAGAETDGISVPAIEQRMGEPMPTAPATLDPDYAQRWMAAYDAERSEPTPWQLRDTTGCAATRLQHDDTGVDIVGAAQCLCCDTGPSAAVSGHESPSVLEVHLCNDEDAADMGMFPRPGLAVRVCARCHAQLHEPYGPTVMDILFVQRPPCPECSRHQALRLMWGMPPTPPPPGTIAAGCTPGDDGALPDYRCRHCGHTWSVGPEPQHLEEHWSEMAGWLVESMTDKPVGFVLDLGPRDYSDGGEDEQVVCAQIQVLDNDVMLLRRSTVELGHLLLADYSTAGVVLDRWYFDNHFDDCTDGYFFSRDLDLIATTCVAWFRDNWGIASVDDIGCSYRFADTLLPPPDLRGTDDDRGDKFFTEPH